jgi:hypothetical protein
MEIKNTNSIASINYAEVKISVDELEVYEAALNFALENLSDEEIESKFGAKREEIEGILDDIKQTISECKASELVAA